MDILKRNISVAIMVAVGEGTTAMSIANLKQVTSTAGLQISPAAYNNGFEEAAREVAAAENFRILD